MRPAHITCAGLKRSMTKQDDIYVKTKQRVNDNMLNLPPIPGEINPPKSKEEIEASGEEDFDFESIPFKPEYLYTDRNTVKEELREGKKIFGTAAASLTWGIDGNRMIPALAAGVEGENQTASTLRELVEKTKGMYLFHSLAWPESNGDTDHVILYGNTILIIDSKRWKGARKYSVTPQGEIKRGTVAFPEGKVKIRYALKGWRRKFPNHKVLGIVTIAQEKVFVVRDQNWYKAPFRLVENEKLVEFLEEMMEGMKVSPPSIKALTDLSLLTVKARDRASEIINVGAETRKPGDPDY